MKPTKQMMVDAKKLKNARRYIDEKRMYRMEFPNGKIFEYSGAEVIRTCEALAELLYASNSGDDERVKAAVQRINAIDCDT